MKTLLTSWSAALVLAGLASAQSASVTDYGKVSTTANFVPHLPTSPFDRTFNATAGSSRGFYFQAPVQFTVTGLNVPNENKDAKQTVALFSMAKAPPTWPSFHTTTAADVRFFALDAPAGKAITFAPIVIQKGAWVAVLGGTGDGVVPQLSSSYSVREMPMNVLGHAFVARRFLTQSLLRNATAKAVGLGVATEGIGDGPCGRVEIYVTGQQAYGPSPQLSTVGLPKIGTTPALRLLAVIPSAQIGLVMLGVGRLPGIPTPYGNLNIPLPLFLTVAVPGGSGDVRIPIPNDAKLVNAVLNWQGVAFDFTTPVYGMTNGNEWVLGN